MEFGTKLLLTSIIFIIIGAVTAGISDEADNDNGIFIGMCIIIISAIALIISLLIMIWS